MKKGKPTPPAPAGGSPASSQTGSPNPMDEQNTPPNDPVRRSVERKMREPSNVRPSDEPTPEKEPRHFGAGTTEDIDTTGG